jgi:prepilin-type N-terminal cleavage/methylation domain-containing protein
MGRGFTMVELLVALAIIGLILASIVPYVLSIRENANRLKCADNLRAIRDAMSVYRTAFGSYPRTRVDASARWTAYTGADDANPFARDSAVQPNDATACMWLLVRDGYLTDPGVFVCPSTSDWADPLRNTAGREGQAKQRSNFRSKQNLSYSITLPSNPAWTETEWSDTLASNMVIMADMNPGVTGRRSDVTNPAAGDPAGVQAWANSTNHGRAGQNVLYPGGNVSFEPTAFCGVDYLPYRPRNGDKPEQAMVPGDNIYTSLLAGPTTGPTTGPATLPTNQPPTSGPGAFGRTIGPNWKYDSYLVPSDDD